MKKLLALAMSALLITIPFTGCKGAANLEGAHIFMFKSTGNSFGNLMFDGFKELISSKGGKAENKSPVETTVAAQVKLIDELISQKVASITISANGDTGYDDVFDKANSAGIKIVSVDSKIGAGHRVTHVDPAGQADVGRSLIQAAVLIALKKDYPGDGKLQEASDAALAAHTGGVLKFGVLSASVDTPVQNGWIAKMEEELQRGVYTGKVDPLLDKKYGNDQLTESTTQTTAFITENTVDVIISPTTVGMAAAGQALKTSSSNIKLTGLGLPKEMQSFMPSKETDNAQDFVCPFMMLWDPIDLGRIAAAATWATLYDNYDGRIDSTFKVAAAGDYPERTFTTVQHPDDSGTLVLVGQPIVFYKGNMNYWKNKL